MTATVQTGVEPRRAKSTRILAGIAVFLALLAVVYVAISAYMTVQLTHPPHLPIDRTPAQFGLNYTDVSFSSVGDNIPLRGWYIDSPGDQVILILHGHGGNRASETDITLARPLVRHNYDVLMFDFRGHGESGDAPVSVGEHEVRDLAGAVRYLKTRGVQQVGVIGMSMGADTALNAAPDQPELAALVVDGPFADASVLLDADLPKRSGLPAWFNPGVILMGKLLYGIHLDENKPVNGLGRLGTRPVLHVHGTLDDDIPLSQAEQFRQAGAHNPNFQQWIVADAGHTQAHARHPEEYEARVLAFFDMYLAR